MSFEVTAASALGICRRFVAAPSWADLKPSEFSVAAVTGGLTNKLFKATNKRPGADPHHVLLRIYCGMSLTLPYSPDAPFWMSLACFLPGLLFWLSAAWYAIPCAALLHMEV